MTQINKTNYTDTPDPVAQMQGHSYDGKFKILAREGVKYNPDNAGSDATLERDSVETLKTVVVVVDDSNTYIGEARSGTATSEAKWRIKKIVVDGGTTTISYADGSTDFDKEFDERASYSY